MRKPRTSADQRFDQGAVPRSACYGGEGDARGSLWLSRSLNHSCVRLGFPLLSAVYCSHWLRYFEIEPKELHFKMIALTFCGTKDRSELDQIAEASP